MEMVINIFIFALGLIIGSFLNVVVYRYGNRFLSKPRSECFSCGHVLSFFDLVPFFSFLLLNGRCRYCKSKISFQYPLVELSSGVLFLATYLKLGLIPELPFYLVVWSIFLAIFVYDLKHKIIPDGLSYALAFLTFVFMFVSLPNVVLLDMLAGPIIALPFAFLWLVSQGRWMGFGDAKLALSIGWLLGIAGGFSAIILAFWVGAVVGLILIFISKLKDIGLSQKFKNLTIKSEIPFAPFLIIGTLIVFFWGLRAYDILLYL